MNRIRTLFVLVAAPEDAPPWRLTSAAIAVIFAFAAMIAGIVVAYTWIGLENQGLSELVGWSLGGVLTILFIWQTRRHQRDALRLAPPQTPILFIMFIAFGCALALDLLGLAVTNQFAPAQEFTWLNPNALGVAEWGFAIALMVVIQPIAEELLFRGVAFPAVRARLGAWGAILATAVVSGVFHVLIYPMNYASLLTPIWYGLVVTVIEAILFGMVRSSSKSTRAAIAAHAAFGLFAVVKLFMLVGR